MSNAKQRRVTVRRAEAGASDPIQKARQAGIREGREQAKAEYDRAMVAAVERAKADERAIRDEALSRMEKEIEDLTLRCQALELQKGALIRDTREWTSANTDKKDWIAQFDEEESREVRRRGGPLDP